MWCRLVKISLDQGLVIDSEPIICQLISFMSCTGVADLKLSQAAFRTLFTLCHMRANQVHSFLAANLLFNNVAFLKAIGKYINFCHKLNTKKELVDSLKLANMCYREAKKELTSTHLSTLIYDSLEDMQLDHCGQVARAASETADLISQEDEFADDRMEDAPYNI